MMLVYGVTGGSTRLVRHDLNRTGDALWIALSRFFWGLALSWLTLMCVLDRAHAINKFLSSSWWLPASRLTFSAYLLHPIVLSTFYSSLPSFYYTRNLAIYFFLGNAIITFACALVLNLAVEAPLAALERKLLF